jgi:hypothetical protein
MTKYVIQQNHGKSEGAKINVGQIALKRGKTGWLTPLG